MISWALLALVACVPESTDGGGLTRFAVDVVGGAVSGTVEVRDGSESVRVGSGENGDDLAFDATFGPTDLTWHQVVGTRERQIQAHFVEDGFVWTSRVGLGLTRRSGNERADAVHASAMLPMENAWDLSSLAAETWLAIQPELGEVRDLSSFNLMEGRIEPGWIAAREEVELETGGRPVSATRLFAWTASWGISLWTDGDGHVLAMDAPMRGISLRRSDISELPGFSARLPESLIEEDLGIETPEVHLAGTLTRPREALGLLPGLILVHGSGPIDRNGGFLGVHDGSLRTLAWEMAARGFAVVRWDKRGVGESTYNGDPPPMTLDALAGDAKRWADLLAARPEIRPDALFIAGHSEGGYIGPMVAADDSRFRGVIMLAGPAHRLDRILADQLVLILRAHGADQGAIDRLARAQAISMKLLRTGKDRDIPGAPSAERSAAWLRSHLAHDPEATLARVRAPLLAFYGSDDLQVPPSEAGELRRISTAQGRMDDRIEVLEGMDHLLMPVLRVPGMGAYSDPDRQMDPRLLAIMGEWLEDRVAP